MHFSRRASKRKVEALEKGKQMSDLNQRTPENVPGRYYVDDTCIDCGLCPSTLPACFIRQDEKQYSYVFRQPVTPEELALDEEALLHCPSDSIGHDGETVPAPA